MKPRFRFRNRKGEEVEVPSLERLTELFESGTLHADSPLHDALSGGWARARQHPVGQLILEELGITERPSGTTLRREKTAGTGTESPTAGPLAGPPQEEGDADLPGAESHEILALEPIPEEHLQEDPVQAFLEAREQERREEELQGASDTGEVTLVDHTQEELAWSPGDFRHLRDPAPRPPGRPGRGKGTGKGRRRWHGPGTRDAPRMRSLSRAQGGGPRQFRLFVLLLSVGAWGILDAWTPGLPTEPLLLEARSRPGPGEAGPGAAPLVAGDREARDAAFDEMVAGMDRVRERMRVGEPPAPWMSGSYLAEAAAYPEVASYWLRYRDFVDTLRAQEVDLFLGGFRDRMEAEGIRGSVLEVREARVLQDFRADSVRRNATYAAMDELADAALTLHAFLRARTADIEHAPVDRGPSDDPVLEIRLLDDGVRGELWTRLDRLLAALDTIAGPDPDRRRDVTRRILGTLGTAGSDTEN